MEVRELRHELENHLGIYCRWMKVQPMGFSANIYKLLH